MSETLHPDDSTAPLHLTAAEAQILSFLPTHLTVEAIADRLGRSRSTVKTHVAHIYAKLGASGRAEAVERAWELGLLAEPEVNRALLGSSIGRAPGVGDAAETATTPAKGR